MRRTLLALTAAAAATTLVACGSDEEAGTTGTAASSAAASGPIVIEGERGTVELDAPAQRVVALEWSEAEDLLALGVTPVGMADVEGYGDWVAEPDVPEGVEDVGDRQQPSIERIAALEPDLILISEDRAARTYEQLEEIAPTLVFHDGGDASPDGGWESMVEQVREIGQAVGKEAEAQQLLDETDARLAELRAELTDAGLDGAEVALTQAWTDKGTPSARLFADNAIVASVLRRLGLENAWDEQGDDVWGISTVGLEAFRKVQGAWLLTMALEEDNPFTGTWADEQAYQRLEMVREDRVRHLGGDTWTFGGPISQQVFAERVVDALTE